MGNKFRAELTDDEKLARQIVGDESEALFFTADDKTLDKEIENAKKEKFNDSVKAVEDRFQAQVNALNEVGNRMSLDFNGVEIMPLGCYALISPLPLNPFQRIKTSDSGLITDLGGASPTYKSEETGEIKEEEQFVKVGTVVEVGSDCRFLMEGDIVFYNISSEIVVPFFRFGFVAVAEQRVIAVVNEGLTERRDEARRKNMKNE